jgi:hypothetical protein
VLLSVLLLRDVFESSISGIGKVSFKIVVLSGFIGSTVSGYSGYSNPSGSGSSTSISYSKISSGSSGIGSG